VLAEKRAGGGKGRFQRAKPTVLASLGEHPAAGGKIEVLEGKYGPYVSHNGVNATVPKSIVPAQLTVDEAIRLLDERIAKGGGKGGGSKFKKGARKAPSKAADAALAKTPATKKVAAKKPAIKKKPGPKASEAAE
jgi:DNA topoisomerase I